ncbi:MAG: hypothetical protein Q9159_000922 [Coniocarpon cinnabarinum]
MSMTVADASAPREAKPVPNTSGNVFEQLSMKGKTVIVTGAADGIGFAAAEAVAEAGANIALWYNSNPAAVEKGKQLAEQHGIKAQAYQVEVSDPSKVEAAVNKVVQEFGGLDVFVANAGMGTEKRVIDQTVEEYRRLMAVNVDGVFFCAKYAGLVFEKQGHGNLIITSSISAHIVNVPVDQGLYNASKAAVGHLGKSLAREWRNFARVNIISPGFFETKLGASSKVINEARRMAVLGRQGDVKEIKGLFLYLASDASSYQTGSDVIIDGGYTLP